MVACNVAKEELNSTFATVVGNIASKGGTPLYDLYRYVLLDRVIGFWPFCPEHAI